MVRCELALATEPPWHVNTPLPTPPPPLFFRGPTPPAPARTRHISPVLLNHSRRLVKSAPAVCTKRPVPRRKEKPDLRWPEGQPRVGQHQMGDVRARCAMAISRRTALSHQVCAMCECAHTSCRARGGPSRARAPPFPCRRRPPPPRPPPPKPRAPAPQSAVIAADPRAGVDKRSRRARLGVARGHVVEALLDALMRLLWKRSVTRVLFTISVSPSSRAAARSSRRAPRSCARGAPAGPRTAPSA